MDLKEVWKDIPNYEILQMKIKEFKIRCSAIGSIMSNGRGGGLSVSTKDYAKEWVKSQIYGGQKFNGNKYTEKGNAVEDDSIAFIEKYLGFDFCVKNEEYFENEYMTGTPDLIFPDLIVDVKNSWDHWTMPLFEDKLPNKDYYWQAQGYMALTGIDNYKVVYCLMNTPEELLNPWSDVPYDYNKVKDDYRIKVFDIDRCDEDIEKIQHRVIEVREYIKELVIGL